MNHEDLRLRAIYLHEKEGITYAHMVKKSRLNIGTSAFSYWIKKKRNLNKIDAMKLERILFS